MRSFDSQQAGGRTTSRADLDHLGIGRLFEGIVHRRELGGETGHSVRGRAVSDELCRLYGPRFKYDHSSDRHKAAVRQRNLGAASARQVRKEHIGLVS